MSKDTKPRSETYLVKRPLYRTSEARRYLPGERITIPAVGTPEYKAEFRSDKLIAELAPLPEETEERIAEPHGPQQTAAQAQRTGRPAGA